MDKFMILIVSSIIVQFIVDRIKIIIPEQWKSKTVPLLAVAMGLAVAFSTQTGLFSLFGITMSSPMLDYIITGIAYSGGSVAVNELIKLLTESRPSNNI